MARNSLVSVLEHVRIYKSTCLGATNGVKRDRSLKCDFDKCARFFRAKAKTSSQKI